MAKKIVWALTIEQRHGSAEAALFAYVTEFREELGAYVVPLPDMPDDQQLASEKYFDMVENKGWEAQMSASRR